LSGAFYTVEEVDSYCPKAGTWEGECRHAWVAGKTHDRRFSTADLMRACGANLDCAFETLDMRPDSDVLEQVSLCTAWTGRYGDDCAAHALQRWWRRNPSAADVARVAQARTAHPAPVGQYVALRIACGGVGSCAGDPAVQPICEASLTDLQAHPEKCVEIVQAKGKSPPAGAVSPAAPGSMSGPPPASNAAPSPPPMGGPPPGPTPPPRPPGQP
jgi:hypothetical protein